MLARGSLSVAFVAVFTLHFWYGAFLTHGHYTPFSVAPEVSALEFDESAVYAPGPAALWARHELFADDLFEFKAHWFPLPIVHSLSVAPLYFLFGSPETGWIAAHVIAMLVGVALLWTVMTPFFSSTITRALAVLAFLALPFGPRNFLSWQGDSLIQPLEISRIAHPGITFWIFLAALSLTARALGDSQKRPAAVFAVSAGLLGALLFFSYYYYCVAFFLSLATLFALLPEKRKTLIRIGAIGALGAIPYFSILRHESATREFLMPRLGGPDRSVSWVGLVLAIACGAWIFRNRKDFAKPGQSLRIVWIAAICGGALGLSLQLITGFQVQHFHFWNRAIQPLGFLFALATGALLLHRQLERQKWRQASGFAIAALLVAATAREILVTQRTIQFHDSRSDTNQTLTWLRRNTTPGAVVCSTENEFISLLPGVTGRRSFIPLGQRTFAADQEIWRRFTVAAKLEGKAPQAVGALFSFIPEPHLWASLAFQLFLAQRGLAESTKEKAVANWDRIDPREELKTLKADYFILRANAPSEKLEQVFPHARCVYRNASWQIWAKS